jgi:hypothetical protein
MFRFTLFNNAKPFLPRSKYDTFFSCTKDLTSIQTKKIVKC